MDKLWYVSHTVYYTAVNMSHLDLYVPVSLYFKHNGEIKKKNLQKNINRLALIKIIFLCVKYEHIIYKIYKNKYKYRNITERILIKIMIMTNSGERWSTIISLRRGTWATWILSIYFFYWKMVRHSGRYTIFLHCNIIFCTFPVFFLKTSFKNPLFLCNSAICIHYVSYGYQFAF